jgi:hypothetical protein
MSKYLKKDWKSCQYCLYLHTGRINVCDLHGEINLPFESYCNDFECFSCGKTKQEKCECYYENEIKAKYRIGE